MGCARGYGGGAWSWSLHDFLSVTLSASAIANVLTLDEARRIAVNVAKLLKLLGTHHDERN